MTDMTRKFPYSFLWPYIPTFSGLSNAAFGWSSTHSSLIHARLLHTFTTRGTCIRGPAPALAFDIDGVLKRGSQAIPQAQDAIAVVSRANHPFVFLTNGGGSTEASRAEYLSTLLQHHVMPDQVVMAHTPMQDLLPKFAGDSVLICGRALSLQAAQQYGFKRALSPLQLAAALGPDAVPFSRVPLPAEVARQLGQPCPVQEFGAATADSPIQAIMVFTDPDDWAMDLQLCLDVIQHNGVLFVETRREVGVYFGQDDLLWSNSFRAPRLGLGAFRRALSHLHLEATQRELVIDAMYGHSHAEPIYMVGDNPEVDVRGANNAGHPWCSVLVRTGVFQGSGNYDTCPAEIVVENVLDAVLAVQHRARQQHWHRLR